MSDSRSAWKRAGTFLGLTVAVAQAKHLSRQIAAGVKHSTEVFQQAALDGLKERVGPDDPPRPKGRVPDPRTVYLYNLRYVCTAATV